MTCRFRAKFSGGGAFRGGQIFCEDLPGLVGSCDRLILSKQNALLNLFFLVKTVLFFLLKKSFRRPFKLIYQAYL